MIIKTVDFELSAVRPVQWPEDGLPEFAFVGRSNVGKSSLLNKLLGRKSVARVSAKPGKTQQINFFRINESFRFADLPGYGYASVSKTERAKFAKMIETYLTDRQPLVQVFHLIDIRHEPSQLDVEVHEWMLGIGLPVTIVATKLDKIPKTKIPSHVKQIRTTLSTSMPIFPVSSENKVGLDTLVDRMEGIIQEAHRMMEESLDSSSTGSSTESDAVVGDHHARENEGAPDGGKGTEDVVK